MARYKYFAYGSNMDVEQMQFRCPDAKRLAPAVLRDYKLTERQFADIDESAGGAVYGLLWSISESDLLALDRYEGFPRLYVRKTVAVAVKTKRGLTLYPAIVYIMTPETKQSRNGRSYTDYYRDLCSRAAKAAGIPDEFAE